MFTLNKNLILASSIAFTLALSGCNTVAGVGKDLQGGGKSLENSAHEVHQQIKNDHNSATVRGNVPD